MAEPYSGGLEEKESGQTSVCCATASTLIPTPGLEVSDHRLAWVEGNVMFDPLTAEPSYSEKMLQVSWPASIGPYVVVTALNCLYI